MFSCGLVDQIVTVCVYLYIYMHKIVCISKYICDKYIGGYMSSSKTGIFKETHTILQKADKLSYIYIYI